MSGCLYRYCTYNLYTDKNAAPRIINSSDSVRIRLRLRIRVQTWVLNYAVHLKKVN
jgi:hypothetical protein